MLREKKNGVARVAHPYCGVLYYFFNHQSAYALSACAHANAVFKRESKIRVYSSVLFYFIHTYIHGLKFSDICNLSIFLMCRYYIVMMIEYCVTCFVFCEISLSMTSCSRMGSEEQ